MDIPKQKISLLPVFFLSGFSALVYEVIWARMLSLVFGSTVEAVSAVVTAFMFGLALGSYFMGRWLDKQKNLLLIYSLTEAGIAISGLTLYFITISLPQINQTLYKILNINEAHALFQYGSYIVEFLLVATPTALMGATFPLMVKSYVQSNYYIGRGTGIVYAVNTFGAVFGAFLSGFMLMPYFGIRTTIFIAVSINIALALLILLIRAYGPLMVSNPAKDAKEPLPDSLTLSYPPTSIAVWSVLAVLGLSGFASMAYQVAWTRLLTMVIGNSVYAFSTILSTFLGGIAIGSLLFAKQTDWKIKDKLLLLGLVQGGIFVSVILPLPLMDSLPAFFIFLLKNISDTFRGLVFINYIIAAIAIMLPTLLMGITFPIATKIYSTRINNMAEGMGVLYTANTIGCIFGALLTGFYIIPAVGVQKTIIATSGLNLLGACLLIIQSKAIKQHAKAILTSGFVAFYFFSLMVIPTWNKQLLNLGVYYQAPIFKKAADLNLFSDNRKLLFYEEGVNGTVAVSKTRKNISLQINGKTDGGTTETDMPTQVLVSALPLLMHPDPKVIAVIGLGTGISLGTATRFPVEKIDCVELLPEVVKANRYFSNFNHNALNNERVNLIIDDGRRYLTYNDKKYDVIISEPSNPWIAGISNLFTLEFFKIAKSRLKDDGIMSQWIQLYSIDTNELKILLNTFKNVFPYVSVWVPSLKEPFDLIILGSKNRIDLNPERIGRRILMPGIKEDLQDIDIDKPESLFARYLMGNKELDRFCKGAQVNTDNHPIIEFQTPKTMHIPTVEKNLDAIVSSATMPVEISNQ